MTLFDLFITALDWHEIDFVELSETTLDGKKHVLYSGYTTNIPPELMTNKVTYWFTEIVTAFTEQEPIIEKHWFVNLE